MVLLSRSSSVRPHTGHFARSRVTPRRTVRASIFRRDSPVDVLDLQGAVDPYNEPTKRQREQVKRTLMDLGFTEQASEILAYGKITNSNADLLIGDIRASFGLYQPPPPNGPLEQAGDSVRGLLGRLRLPFLALLMAAGSVAVAASSQVMA